MLARHDGKVIVIQFTHIRPKKTTRRDRSKTQCVVFFGVRDEKKPSETYEFGGVGIAVVSKNDQFCKEVGRKIALTQALKTMSKTMQENGITDPELKRIRSSVWASYFARKGQKVAAPSQSSDACCLGDTGGC